MKKLKLTEPFKSKIDRLSVKAGSLTYQGADLETYKDSLVVAIVGTRKPTPYGKMITEKLTEDLSRAGIVIISGLALGIDALAHKSCINVKGKTISVVPRNSYPKTNANVAKDIIANAGTIISDDSDPKIPIRVAFLQRNRIVAALSDAVIIPEAAINSGSLNTARVAMEMNIPVFVVPGNITSPMSSGTNYLLKNGALAITEAADVLKFLQKGDTKPQLELNLVGDSPEETLILQKLSIGINNAAELQSATGINTVEFQTAVTMLEIQGRISQDSLGDWRITNM